MIKKIIILSISIIVFVFVAVTGCYKYDPYEIHKAVKRYEKLHKCRNYFYREFIDVCLMKYQPIDDTREIMMSNTIKYNGVYYTEMKTYFKYLKFYKDSFVITFITNYTPSEVTKLIDEKMDTAPKGRYYIEDVSDIRFTTMEKKTDGKVVQVEYSGESNDDKLYLYSYSKTTQNESDLIYVFYEEK